MKIMNKYMRKIERFRAKVKNSTCFIQLVIDQDEMTYIMENLDYIDYVIKKSK